MKPFNLEAAKAGAALITRDGRDAQFIAHLPGCETEYRLLALIAGARRATTHCEDGAVFEGYQRPTDLFMATRKRTVWINLYRVGAQHVATYPYLTREAAATSPHQYTYFVGTFPIEFED